MINGGSERITWPGESCLSCYPQSVECIGFQYCCPRLTYTNIRLAFVDGSADCVAVVLFMKASLKCHISLSVICMEQLGNKNGMRNNYIYYYINVEPNVFVNL